MMKKLVTDTPVDNGEMMMNLVFVKNNEVWIRCGGEDGQDCPLTTFCKRMCTAHKDCSFSEVAIFDTYVLEDIGDMLMECSSEGCPVGTTYFAMIQAAELRERLRLYENHDVLPDDLERLTVVRGEDGGDQWDARQK